MTAGRRSNNKPWKHIYGVDRKYTARVDRLRERTVRVFARETIEQYHDAFVAMGDA